MSLETGAMTLKKPDPSKMLASFSKTLTEAMTLQVSDLATAKRAGELLRTIKGGEKLLLDGDPSMDWEGFNEPVDAAFKAHKFLTKLRTMTLDPYTQTYATLNNRLLSWEAAERQKAEEEARKRQEAARREEEERKIREAVAAEEQGDKVAAAEILVQPITVPTIVPEDRPKIEGRSITILYSAQVDNLLALVKYVVEHPEDVNLLEPNMTALNQRAKSQKDGFELAGCSLLKRDVARTSKG